MSDQDNAEIAGAGYDAFNRNDLDACVVMVAADMEYVQWDDAVRPARPADGADYVQRVRLPRSELRSPNP